MPGMTIGETLDQGRPLAAPRLVKGLLHGPIDDVGVISIDSDLRQAVGPRPIRRRIMNRGHFGDRRILHVKVVLADDYYRQLPDNSEVQRLMKCPDICGAIPEKTYLNIGLRSEESLEGQECARKYRYRWLP